MNKIKKSLLMSAVSLLLCISMLIGSTFAWFTDSVTSASNKIQSGTLKLDLELLDKETGKWNSLKESQAPIFNYDKWEPGYIDIKVLKVENEGNLALKWVAKFYSEKQLSILADVIDVYVRPSDSEIGYPANRSLEGYTCVGNLTTFINSIEETTQGTLEAKEAAYLGIALKMREEAGNEYQNLSLGGAFDIRIFATQHTSESDSFGNQYDKNSLFEDFVDKSILTTKSKYISDGAESVDFAIFHKGVRIVAASVPASAIANKDKPVTITIRAIDSYIEAGENTQSFAYDIDVTNLKSNLKGDQLVTVVIAAPKGLASIKAYHKNELLTDAVYDEVEGTITFKTASFSPFEFTTQTFEAKTLGELREMLQIEGAYVKLTDNITVNLTKDAEGNVREAAHAYPDIDNPKYYNGVKVEGKNVALDLNGHSITAFCGDKYNSNDDVGALFFVGKDGSLNICDTVGGGYIKMASSIYAVWAPYASPSYVDIYSGAFIADSYADDLVGTALDSNGKPDSVNGTMSNEQENANRALIYAGHGGNINVYGGYFLYNNTVNDVSNRNNGAFNAKDYYEDGALITIHAGVYLSNKEYRQNPYRNPITNPSFDDFSVVLSQYGKISETTVNETIKIGDKDFNHNWYKVVPNYKYKITFMNEDGTKVLDTQYIGEDEDSVTLSTTYGDDRYIDKDAKSKLTGEYVTNFGGWVNAASEPVENIDAGNKNDIILYPTLQAKYTVRWVDENGNVISTAIVTKVSNKNPTYSSIKSSEPQGEDRESKYANMKFDHWEVREIDENKNETYTDLSKNADYEITKDITVYPFYSYDGNIGLTPHDTDGDGRANYYTVEAASGLDGKVTIPGYVNGVQVVAITDLSGDWVNGLLGGGIATVIIENGVEEIGSKAFAGTASLKNVTIPKSVTKIGKNAFAEDDWLVGGLGSWTKQITITYEGTKKEWNDIDKADGWDDNTRKITVNCTDGTLTY